MGRLRCALSGRVDTGRPPGKHATKKIRGECGGSGANRKGLKDQINNDNLLGDRTRKRQTMKLQRSLWATALIAGAIGPAAAFAPDGCEQQRAQCPAN